MLLNFRMKNFRSFRDDTFFTMLASKQKTHSDYIINDEANGNKLRVLPMSVIYGANACGKSNIILAMNILKNIIMEGTLECKTLEPYKSTLSFIRDNNWYEPIMLEITFFTSRNIYKYRIMFTDIDVYKIVEEVLYINDENIFTRNENGKINVDVNHLMRKGYIRKDEEDFSKRLIDKLNQTLDKQRLVVTGAISNLFDKRYFDDFFSWFKNFNVIMNANDMNFKQKDLRTIVNQNVDGEGGNKFWESDAVKEIMDIAEFGNQKIRFVSDKDNEDLSMCSMYRVPFEHESDKYYISMLVDSEIMESKGTIHLIRLIQPFIDALSEGGVIVLDEMDASLHFELDRKSVV